MARIAIVGNWLDANVITHPAPHHADEVFATVMLARVFGNVEDGFSINVYRTRDPEIIAKATGKAIYSEITADERAEQRAVCDIGGVYDPRNRLFDHHMADFRLDRYPHGDKKEGVKYATSGLIWKEYGVDIAYTFGVGMPEVLDQKKLESIARTVDHNLIEGIDAFDNGELEDNGQMSVSTLIQLINARDDEETVPYDRVPGATTQDDHDFLLACNTAELILERAVKQAISIESAREDILEAIRDTYEKQYIVLGMPCDAWRDIILELSAERHDYPLDDEALEDIEKARKIKFCVYPSKNCMGVWCVQAVPPGQYRLTEQRKPFPEHWWGLSNEAFIRASGVRGALCCHPGGFFATARTRTGAIILAEKAVDPFFVL